MFVRIVGKRRAGWRQPGVAGVRFLRITIRRRSDRLALLLLLLLLVLFCTSAVSMQNNTSMSSPTPRYEVMRFGFSAFACSTSLLTLQALARVVEPAHVDAMDAFHVLAHGEGVFAIELETPCCEKRLPVRRGGRRERGSRIMRLGCEHAPITCAPTAESKAAGGTRRRGIGASVHLEQLHLAITAVTVAVTDASRGTYLGPFRCVVAVRRIRCSRRPSYHQTKPTVPRGMPPF